MNPRCRHYVIALRDALAEKHLYVAQSLLQYVNRRRSRRGADTNVWEASCGLARLRFATQGAHLEATLVLLQGVEAQNTTTAPHYTSHRQITMARRRYTGMWLHAWLRLLGVGSGQHARENSLSYAWYSSMGWIWAMNKTRMTFLVANQGP